MGFEREWRAYVPRQQRRASATRAMQELRKNGTCIEPLRITGRKIATSFWGAAWCTHLEKFSDYANRLPRGRTYARNGSVCHLAVRRGVVEAMVQGSELYEVGIKVTAMSAVRWRAIVKQCACEVGSVLDLLQGRLSDRVMRIVTDRDSGLFPGPKELSMECSCPDWAGMCKHVAAVMYGIGARLDSSPELLYTLRGVDHTELVAAATAEAVTRRPTRRGAVVLSDSAVSDVFGIDVAPLVPVVTTRKVKPGSEKTSIAKAGAKTGNKTGKKPASKTSATALRKRAKSTVRGPR